LAANSKLDPGSTRSAKTLVAVKEKVHNSKEILDLDSLVEEK
jgi:hypothetical protein